MIHCENVSGISRKIVSNISAYIIAFCLVISTGSSWLYDESLFLNENQLYWWILSIVIFLNILVFLTNIEVKPLISLNMKKKGILFLICCVTYIYKFQGDFEEYFSFFFLLILWFMIFLYQMNEPRIVWNAFVNIVVFFSIISLIFYVGGTCLNIIPASGRTSLIWGTWTEDIRTFYNIYYESQFLEVSDTLMIPRNCGIFPEGPMYNFVICIGIASELFMSTKVHWWKVILLGITAITTFSTTAYLFLIITIVFYFGNIIFSQKNGEIHKVAFLLFGILGGMGIIGIMLQKLTTPSGVGSMNVRGDHFLACLKAWIDSPIIGVGFQNQEAVLAYAKYQQGMSMGLIFFIACGGILMTSLLVIPYVMHIVQAFRTKHFNELIFETLYLILYFVTAVSIYPIFRFFIAYILIYEDRGQLETKDLLAQKLIKFFNQRNYNLRQYYKRIKEKKIYIGSFSIAFSGMVLVFLIIKDNAFYPMFLIYGILAFVIGILLNMLSIYIKVIAKGKQ